MVSRLFRLYNQTIMLNNLHLLRRLSAASMLLAACWTCMAQNEAALPSSAVTVNGKVVTRKVTSVELTTDNNGFLYNGKVPRVAIIYEHDEGQPLQDGDYNLVHPIVCRVLFGNKVETGLRDLSLREIQQLSGNELRLSGLREGEMVRVYNAAGRLCLTTRATASGAVVSLKALPRDLYIIKAGNTAFKYINHK